MHHLILFSLLNETNELSLADSAIKTTLLNLVLGGSHE